MFVKNSAKRVYRKLTKCLGLYSILAAFDIRQYMIVYCKSSYLLCNNIKYT